MGRQPRDPAEHCLLKSFSRRAPAQKKQRASSVDQCHQTGRSGLRHQFGPQRHHQHALGGVPLPIGVQADGHSGRPVQKCIRQERNVVLSQRGHCGAHHGRPSVVSYGTAIGLGGEPDPAADCSISLNKKADASRGLLDHLPSRREQIGEIGVGVGPKPLVVPSPT